MSRGFTLIELLVAIAIAAILMMLAAPNYAVWVADSEVRAGADSVAAGLRYAQAEAVKRNALVEFVLDPTVGTGGWEVREPGGPTKYQSGSFGEGARRVQVAVAPAGTTIVTFNGLGIIATPNADASMPFEAIDFGIAGVASRPLRVLVGGTRTGIKICDPALTPPEPRACPPLGG